MAKKQTRQFGGGAIVICAVILGPAAAAFAQEPPPRWVEQMEQMARQRPPPSAGLEESCLEPAGGAATPAFVLRLVRMSRFGVTITHLPSVSRGVTEPAALADTRRGQGWVAEELEALIESGVRHIEAGQLEAAQRQLERCAVTAEKHRDLDALGACSNNLGVVAALGGRAAQAQQAFERAVKAYAQWHEQPTAIAPSGMAQDRQQRLSAQTFPPVTLPEQFRMFPPEVQAQLRAQLQASRDQAQRTMAAMPSPSLSSAQAQLTAKSGVVRSLLNLGNLVAHQGRHREAEGWLLRALDPASYGMGVVGTRATRVELARLYRRVGHVEQAAAQERQVQESSAQCSVPGTEAGVVALTGESGDATIAGARVHGSGGAAPAPGPMPAAPAVPAATAAAPAEAARMASEEFSQRLQSAAVGREQAGDRRGAARLLAQAAFVAGSGAQPERERALLADLHRLHASMGEVETSIFYGKLAVNAAQVLREAQRAERQALPRDARRAYLAQRRASYVRLARQLLDRQRLGEAEQVLLALREDEGRQFLTEGDVQRRRRIDMGPTETAAATEVAQFVARSRKLGEERVEVRGGNLMSLFTLGADGADVERARLQEVDLFDSFVGQAEQQWSSLRASVPAGGASRRPGFAASAAAEAPRIASEQDAATVGLDFIASRMADRLGILRRDLVDFRRVRPTADEVARVEALHARARRVSEAVAPLAARLRSQGVTEPASPARGAVERMLPGFGLARTWAIDRDLAAIEGERERFVERLAARLESGAAPAPAAAPLPRLAPANAVLHVLSEAGRSDLLLVSTQGRRHWRIDLPQRELDAALQALQTALQSWRRDARPAAQALYRQLFAPADEALRAEGVEVLWLSLAGQARFVPFGALHDGRGWLAERFALGLVTGAVAPTRPLASASSWRVAAFGSSRGGSGFDALPGVRTEIEGIVGQATVGRPAAPRGVFPGRVFMDDAFTLPAFQQAVRERFNVLHIASHFHFEPGNAAASRLLMGDGSTTPLSTLAAPAWRLDSVDLITLSACKTALSDDDGFGLEVDGLAALLQAQGAGAIVASLWSVSDDSTAQLMRTFYAQMREPGVTVVQALRRAQLELIGVAREKAEAQRDMVRPGTGGSPAAGAAPSATPNSPTNAPPNTSAGAARNSFAHPYFWAAFVLWGDGER